MPNDILKTMLALFTTSLLLVSAVFIFRGGRACQTYWLAWTGLAATMIGDYPLCHYLFSFSLAASAFVSARFFPALSCFVKGARKKSVFLWSGALNAGGLLAIALVPENVHGFLHNVGCFAAVGGGAIMLLLLLTPWSSGSHAAAFLCRDLQTTLMPEQ